MKQEQKPLNKISFLELQIVLAITKPYKNEPIIETKKLLSIKSLKNVAKYAINNIKMNFFLFKS